MLEQQKKLLNIATETGKISINKTHEKTSLKDMSYVKQLEKEPALPKEQPTDWPAMNFATERPVDSSFLFPVVTWDEAVAFSIFELARFYVPWGNYGVITDIDQVLNLDCVTLGGNYATKNDFRGKLYVEDTWGVVIHYHLRLQPWQPQGIPEWPLIPQVVGDLPGVPYNYLARWSDTRFLGAQPEELHYPVQGGNVIRFFCEILDRGIRPGALAMALYGRLAGYLQGARSHAATFTARRQW